ncbi:unnamed protein product, partial [Sphacelaria rigidula]
MTEVKRPEFVDQAELEVYAAAVERLVDSKMEGDGEALGKLEPVTFPHSRSSHKANKDAPKPPLVIELQPTSWRVRTSSTERQYHGHGHSHKKTANLQYCTGSRQVMLDLDTGRFPLQLMWALPEVKMENGCVLAEIH